MKKIILLLPYANHSNRLFQNLHAEAFCIEKGISYFNPYFSDMAKYYECSPNLRFPDNMSFCEKVLCLIMKNGFVKKAYKKIFPMSFGGFYYFRDEVENASDYVFNEFKKRNNIFIGGFNFRFPELTEKYQSLFMEKYALKKEFYENNELVKEFLRKKDGKTAVGIHIRRGDYKIWENGKYYFEDDVYRKYMDGFASIIRANFGKKCMFLICSNEKTSFENDESILVSTEEWFIDQYLLSKCDYIIAPIGTFSRWAAFIGKTKVFNISNDSGDISLDNFEYCVE